MEEITKKNDIIFAIPVLQGWDNKDKDEKRYSFNDLTNCYLYAKEQGKKEFLERAKEGIKKNFKKDIKNVQKMRADFYKFIIKNGIKINQLRLKIRSFSEFKLLYIISKESFLSDKLNKVLDESHNITDENNNIEISFMPYNKFLNIDKLLLDGFTFTYGNK